MFALSRVTTARATRQLANTPLSVKSFKRILSSSSSSGSSSQKPKKKWTLWRGAKYLFVAGVGVYFLDLWVNDDLDSITDRFRTKVSESERKNRPKIVILGTGWGTLNLLRKLHTDEMQVTVVSPRNYFLFTPMLTNTTTGTIELRSIIEPIRKYCHRADASEVTFYEAECTSIDPTTKKITCQDISPIKGKVNEFSLEYDHLVIAVGADTATFGIPGVKENACFMKEMDDARVLRDRILDCFETASYPNQPEEEIDRLLHHVIVGAGPSGTEFAGELNDFLRTDLSKNFPELSKRVRITLIDALPTILSIFDKKIIEYAEKKFKEEHVEVLTKTSVTAVKEKSLTAKSGDEIKEIPYGLLVWVTGNAPRKLTLDLIKKIGPAQNCRRGLAIDEFFRVKGAENIWAIGDCSCSNAPPTAQVAAQQGRYLGRLFNSLVHQMQEERQAKIEGKQSTALSDALKDHPKFVFNDFGSFAYLGDYQAVGQIKGTSKVFDVTGLGAFFLWNSVYFTKLLSYRNRFLVMFDWIKTQIFGRDISRG